MDASDVVWNFQVISWVEIFLVHTSDNNFADVLNKLVVFIHMVLSNAATETLQTFDVIPYFGPCGLFIVYYILT